MHYGLSLCCLSSRSLCKFFDFFNSFVKFALCLTLDSVDCRVNFEEIMKIENVVILIFIYLLLWKIEN